MHIARNRFWNGGTTHWGISWKQSIYEDNVATGVSTTAMGSNYPQVVPAARSFDFPPTFSSRRCALQYQHNDGAPHVQNIYHHNNSQNMVWGNDREMMTSDAGGGVYVGFVEAQTEGALNQVTLSEAAAGPQPGGAFCVLSGTNTGDCRRVVSSTSSGPLKPPAVPATMASVVVAPCEDACVSSLSPSMLFSSHNA